MIADGIERTFSPGHRAHTPAGKQPVTHEVVDAAPGLLFVRDAAPQQMSDIRGEGVDLSLVAVQAKRKKFALRKPEVLIETPLQLFGLSLELLGPWHIFPNVARQTRSPYLGIIGIALQLARRSRRRRQRAIGERNRIPGVFPALVLEPFRVSAFIFDIAITVAIAVLVDPGYGSARFPFQRAHESAVSGPAFVFLKEDQEQGRRVRAPVVGGVWRLFKGCQLAKSQFVRDFAWLRIAKRIIDAGLQKRQASQCGAGEFGKERERLKTREQAVPSEDRHEPRQSGCGESTRHDLGAKTKCREICEASTVDVLERPPG